MATIKANKDGLAVGKSGNDTVLGDSRANVLLGGGGNDTLRGRGATDAIDGGIGNDKLYGDSGDDLLSGGLGRDTLIGGAGSDYFGFDTKLSSSNVDVIDDFNVKADTIALYKKIFKVSANPKGAIKEGAFWTGSSAHDADDRLIYDKATGSLYYDPDGTGAKAAVQFAQLDANLNLTHKDFIIF
ncbi:calcium-binding protein [Microvirga zambiensis]|uniref:calcium-binding protein n=1 Tax=Microvirga zambiensis TaxID=1402137 RepID=UPI00191CAD8B|nr:calcium-binding protein [Microvirga zambiensis]